MGHRKTDFARRGLPTQDARGYADHRLTGRIWAGTEGSFFVVLKEVRNQVDADSKDWVQLYESCSDHAKCEQVSGRYHSRENQVDPQTERVEFQPFLARPGLKDGPPVVLVDQLSRGIGPHFD